MYGSGILGLISLIGRIAKENRVVATWVAIRHAVVVVPHVGFLRHWVMHIAGVGIGCGPLIGVGIVDARALKYIAVNEIAVGSARVGG